MNYKKLNRLIFIVLILLFSASCSSTTRANDTIVEEISVLFKLDKTENIYSKLNVKQDVAFSDDQLNTLRIDYKKALQENMIVPIVANGDFDVEFIDKITSYYHIGKKLSMKESNKGFKFICDLYDLSTEYNIERVLMYGELTTELSDISTNLEEMVLCLLDYDFYNAKYELDETEIIIEDIKTNYSSFNKNGSIDGLTIILDTLFNDAQSVYDAVFDERYKDADIYKTNIATQGSVILENLEEYITFMEKVIYIIEQYN